MTQITILDLVQEYIKNNNWDCVDGDSYIPVKIHDDELEKEILEKFLSKNYGDYIIIERHEKGKTRYSKSSYRLLSGKEIDSLLGLVAIKDNEIVGTKKHKTVDTSTYHILFKNKNDSVRFKLSYDPDMFKVLNKREDEDNTEYTYSISDEWPSETGE